MVDNRTLTQEEIYEVFEKLGLSLDHFETNSSEKSLFNVDPHFSGINIDVQTVVTNASV